MCPKNSYIKTEDSKVPDRQRIALKHSFGLTNSVEIEYYFMINKVSECITQYLQVLRLYNVRHLMVNIP